MVIRSRAYDKKKDFKSVMVFLAELFVKTQSYENWFPDRFENSSEDREDVIRIWEKYDETTNPNVNKIVALTTRDSPNDFFLHIDPDHRFLEKEMIEWLEKYYSNKKKKEMKDRQLTINILEGNAQREALLTELGYINQKIYAYYRIRDGDTSVPNFGCPKGFKIRAIRKDEFEQQALLIQRVFGHGEWFTSDILEWIASCSFHKEELDLVAVTPAGIIASFCTFRLDPISRIISLEPMGTNPDFRRLGLAKALLTEGIKRSMKYNPPFFYIDGAANTKSANRLYDITGFTEKKAIFSWVKET
ncbi:MAG: GNAT family N-acetyltransferase [Candidatus Heimdallarchaeota archaeon]|nr:GNAT family N-acetyltransferase [Candidatus Heimdallarchaeota archaeon]